MKSKLSLKIIELRKERGWTQYELAKRTGLLRGTLACIESGKSQHPTTDILLKITRAFGIRPEELYEAAGYIKEAKTAFQYKETPEDVLERLKLMIQSVPVYKDFPVHAGEFVEPITYIYRERHKGAPRNIEGYVIRGECLMPVIQDGDIIIVDRDASIDIGDIVAGLTPRGIICGKLKKVAGELYVQNNRAQYKYGECNPVAVVVEVIRKLK